MCCFIAMAPSLLPIGITLAAVGVWVLCIAYMWCQRSVLTGRCVHWECRKRSWKLVTLSCAVYGAIVIVTAAYEVQRAMVGQSETRQPGLAISCTTLLVLSTLYWVGFALPYNTRTLRLVVMYQTSLRSRFGWVLQERYVKRCRNASLSSVPLHLSPVPQQRGDNLRRRDNVVFGVGRADTGAGSLPPGRESSAWGFALASQGLRLVRTALDCTSDSQYRTGGEVLCIPGPHSLCSWCHCTLPRQPRSCARLHAARGTRYTPLPHATALHTQTYHLAFLLHRAPWEFKRILCASLSSIVLGTSTASFKRLCQSCCPRQLSPQPTSRT